MLSGRCYCGATTLTIDARPQVVAYCHCDDCRRVTGAPVAAFAAFPAGSMYLSPEREAMSAFPGVVRRFCPVCGSAMTAEFDYLPEQVYVPIGVLDDAADLAPEMHAHADKCLPWLRIDDALPRAHGSARCTLRRSETP